MKEKTKIIMGLAFMLVAMVITMIGMSAADSESLKIPVAIICAGVMIGRGGMYLLRDWEELK